MIDSAQSFMAGNLYLILGKVLGYLPFFILYVNYFKLHLYM